VLKYPEKISAEKTILCEAVHWRKRDACANLLKASQELTRSLRQFVVERLRQSWSSEIGLYGIAGDTAKDANASINVVDQIWDFSGREGGSAKLYFL
jgi:hypothetical protein